MNEQRRRRNMETLTTLFSRLPDELIVEILLRLPVRSLLRFKSVCKSWRTLISDPQFGKSHFDLAATAPTHRYIGKTNDLYFEPLDIDAPLHDESVVKRRFPPPLSPDKNPNYTYSPSPYDDVWILGSCRGLILLAYDKGNTIVWNPSTGVERRLDLDNLGAVTFKFLTGFGYDKSTDDYLLAHIDLIHWDPDDDDPIENEAILGGNYNNISIFSLRKNSWSIVTGVNGRYVYIDTSSRIGCLLNEALHWLVISFATKLHVIIALDLVERSLSEIPLSQTLASALQSKPDYYYLRVVGECLSIYSPGDAASKAEIWMMKDYKVQSSWTRLFVFSTSNIPRNAFYPICFTKDGGIFGSNGHGRFMILNHKGWLLDQCTLRTEPDAFPWIQDDCGTYRESFLSLPNDFEEASEDVQ